MAAQITGKPDSKNADKQSTLFRQIGPKEERKPKPPTHNHLSLSLISENAQGKPLNWVNFWAFCSVLATALPRPDKFGGGGLGLDFYSDSCCLVGFIPAKRLVMPRRR
jgi:hypothetical protein